MNLARVGIFLGILIVLILLSIAYAINTSLMDARADREARETRDLDWKEDHDNRLTAQQARLEELTTITGEIRNALDDVRKVTARSSELDVKVGELASAQSKLQDRQGALDKERANFEKAVGDLRQTVENLARGLQDSQASSERLSASFADVITRLDELGSEIQATRSSTEKSVAELGELRNKSAVLSVEIMRTRESFESDLQKLVKQLQTSGAPVPTTNNGTEQDRAPADASGTDKNNPATTPITASVAAVSNEDGIVVLDRGSNAGIEVGMRFSIFHGDTWLATVKIRRVAETTSGGTVVRKIDEQGIQNGDRAESIPDTGL